MNPFEPIGEQAQWKYLYDAVNSLQPGSKLSFDKLQEICGLDIKNNRSPIYHANKRLLQDGNKMLLSVRGYGYKIGESKEQLNHAVFRKTRASRQLRKGVFEINNLDTKQLSAEEKILATHLVNHMQSNLKNIQSKNITVLKKAQETIKTQEDTIQQVDKMMAELSSLKDRLS